MGAITSIEWTDASWTPIRARNRVTGRAGWHCTHVSEACRNCYAERRNRWIGTGLAFKPGHLKDIEIFLDEAMLLAPLRWRKPRKIFVCSMTDLFGDFVPDEMIDKVFAVMALAPQHTFQVLTKRPERMRAYLGEAALGRVTGALQMLQAVAERRSPTNNRLVTFDVRLAHDAYAVAFNLEHGHHQWPLPNVWLGTSAEDQPAADVRVPDLLATPAAVRFISYEPALGPINLRSIDISGDEEVLPLGAGWLDRLEEGEVEGPRIDWVICGGESGPHARPMHPDWARSLRDQCAAAGVAFFFKQWGEFEPIGPVWIDGRGRLKAGDTVIEPLGMAVRGDVPGCNPSFGSWRLARVGKARAGRILDGRTHDDLPARAA